MSLYIIYTYICVCVCIYLYNIHIYLFICLFTCSNSLVHYLSSFPDQKIWIWKRKPKCRGVTNLSCQINLHSYFHTEMYIHDHFLHWFFPSQYGNSHLWAQGKSTKELTSCKNRLQRSKIQKWFWLWELKILSLVWVEILGMNPPVFWEN